MCLLNPCSTSVLTQSFASYSCSGVCYEINSQLVHCKNLRCCCEFCCMLMTFPWHVTPLRSSGKLSLPWPPHICFQDLQSVQTRSKCRLSAEMLQLKLQIQSSRYMGIKQKWCPTMSTWVCTSDCASDAETLHGVAAANSVFQQLRRVNIWSSRVLTLYVVTHSCQCILM